MRRLALIPLAIGALVFSPLASALGLGEIEMQSALNQRLDAEIPLRGVPEDDRDRIIVSLASEEAFRQVGLRRPFSLTRLSFEIKQRAGGGEYIHVTSREPIVEPFLSFLIEVDWPDGNLLREYTVLLDPPVFVSDAPEQQPEPAARADTAAAVEPELEPEPEPRAAAEPEMEEIDAGLAATAGEPAVTEPRRRDGDFADMPVFLQVEQEEEEAEARALAEADQPEPEPEVATTSAYRAAGTEYGPIERGEALWNIASRLKNDQMTVQQMMLALLRYNPEAFVDDNINRLRQGYVLRIPDAEAVLTLSAQQAVARVREQNALWQEYRRALRGGTGVAASEPAESDAASSTAISGGDADLQIVGSEQGTGVGSDQEASATSGGGSQSAEELKLARERLESAQLEKAELQSRVDELEETVGKMERLIELREDQLAKLQAQLQQLQQDRESTTGAGDGSEAAADEADAAATGEEVAGEGADAADAEQVTATAAEEEDTEAVAADGSAGGEEPTASTEEPADAAGATDTDGEGAGDDDAASAADEGAEATAAAEGTQVAQADTGTNAASTGSATGRPQPAADPGIVGTVMGTITGVTDSLGRTLGGVAAGLGAGGLIPQPMLLPVLGAVIVLLLLVMLAVRRRRAGAAEEEEHTDTIADSVIAAGGDDSEGDFSATVEEREGPVGGEADAGLADTVAADEDEDAEAELMSETFDLDGLDEGDETVSAAAEGSEDETIAEADVYLAYGLHQQAEDLLKLAVEEQPERLDYRAKLLEAIYADGRSEEFVEQARAMHGKVDAPDTDPHWLRVVAMGKEMAPSEGLFQQDVDESLKPAAAGATSPPETDLDLGDDDATDLDFSFDDEEVGGESDDDAFGETMMLDSSELDSEPEGEAATDDEGETGGMDLDLDDIGSDSESEATRAGAAAGGQDEDEDEGDLELGDFGLDDDELSTDSELPDFGGGSAAAGDDLDDFEQESETSATETEASEETDLSDFDLGSLDEETADTEGVGETAETDEAAEFDFDLSEDDSGGDLDLSEMDLGDLDDSGEDSGGLELDETGDDRGEPELDEAGDDSGGLELEETGDDEDETELAGTDADEDVSLDDLAADLAGEDTDETGGGGSAGAGDEGDDEYQTMIDLAKAYIDMGDAESARSALEEVAEAGSDEQRDEAKSLLETI